MKSKIRQLKTKVLSFLTALLLTSSVYAQLTGGTTVSINGTQSPPSSFSTVSDAFTYLNANGVTGSGTIILEIQSGYTGETTTIPALNAYTGMNALTPIVLKPGFGMTPVISTTLATNNAVIRFNGARFFTIDGSNNGTDTRDLTITTSSTTASNAIVGLTPTASSSAKFITIKNCNLIGNSSTTAVNTAYGIYLGNPTIPGATLAANNDSNRFENNFIGAVRTGVYLRGIGTGNRDNFNIVYRNTIGGNTAPSGSSPTNFIGGATTQAGIYLASQNLAIIDSNIIRNSMPAFYGFRGIDMTLTTQVSTNITISRNSISNIRYTGTGVWGSFGMRINLGSSINNLGYNIFNNAIWNISTDGSTSNTSEYNPYGIYFEGTATNAGVNLYYNSINLYGNPSNFSGSGACILFGSSISGGVRMVNNMLKNTMNGTTTTSLAYTVIAANTTTSPFSVINNNVYFANAAAPTVNRIGFIRNTQAVTLANWQTNTAQDVNSISANPALPNDTNLYVTSGVLGGSGRPIATPTFNINITNDIAGSTRDLIYPAIGASEAVGSPMIYDSSSVEQVIASLPINSNNQPIVRIRIHTNNIKNPLVLTQLKLNTGGTTSVLDIDSAKVFFTGSNPNFATTNQFGSATINPNGSFYVNSSRTLNYGVNYLWVTYSIRSTATASNLVDVDLDSLTISGTQYAPIVSAPAGARTIAPPMNGLYTVGTGGTYPTLNAAFNDLNLLSASGNITFRVVSNITEPGNVIVQQWPETGTGNYRVRVIPTNNDTIFVNSANSGAITLVNADRVTIDGRIGGTGNNLTVINTNTAATAVGILVASAGTNLGCENDSIVNVNILTGANTAASFGIQAQGDNNNNLVIANNTFKRAWGAINVFTTNFPAGANLGLKITGNVIGDVANSMNINRTGINITNSPNALIDNNKIYNMNDILSTLNYGIQIGTNCDSAMITRNKIDTIFNGNTSGYSAYGINITGSNNLLIANNIITRVAIMNYSTSSTTWNPFGIRITAGTGHKIYYNSVNLYGPSLTGGTTGTLSAALLITGGSGMDVRNNIFANSYNGLTGSQSFAIYSTVTAPFTTINYNNYYTSGTYGVLGYLTSNRTTLGNWRTATSQDLFSIAANPYFTANDNLIINSGSTGNQIESAGTTVSVTTDYNGDPRPKTVPTTYGGNTNPDMGAFEFDGQKIDLELPTIVYTPLLNTSLTTNRNLTATITDLLSGVDSINNAPRVYFKKSTDANAFVGNTASDNGWKYTLATKSGNNYTATIDYSIINGGFVSPFDTVQYFYVAQDLAATPNTSALPTAGFVGTGVATITNAPTTPNSYIIAGPPLAGTYTVGNTGTFPTLTNAVGLLNLCGASADVTFSIVSNITEPGNVIIQQWPETGTGNYRLRIVPTSNETISVNSANSGAITIFGADRVTIDGRIGGTGNNLTVINTNTAATAVGILVASAGTNLGCENDSIVNVNILTGANTAASFGIQAQGDNNNNLVIANNTFKRAWGAINVFTTNFPAGANLGLKITGNVIGDVANNMNINRTGINITNSPKALIDNNKLYNINDITSTLNYGIQIGANCDSAMITRNKIDTIFNGNTGGWSAFGINITGSNNLLIANNIITRVALMNYSASSTLYNPFGIRITAGNGHKIYYNSVNLYGPSLSGGSAGTLSAALLITGGTSMDVRNNIFANSYNGLTGSQSFAIYITATAPFTTINYNNYYTSGTYGVLGYLTSNRTTIANWRTATNQDLFSFAGNPYFTANDDLTINSGSTGNQIESAGAIVSVTTDYNGDPRPKTVPTTYGGNTNPDLGAFEFDGQKIDLEVPNIVYTPLSNTSLTTNRNITATITDLLSGVDSTTNAPRVYFKKSTDANAFVGNTASDNGWKYTSATKSGNNYTATIDYSIINGGFVTLNDTVEYFYVAQDVASTPNTSALPAAGFVGTGVASITNAPTTPNRYIITNPPLAGTYTVGSTGTFPTLTAAVNALNVVGVSAPVIFNLIDASYTSSTETFPITIIPFGGASNTNRLTIKPASSNSVSISGSSATSIFRLNGADYVTIDGSNNGTSSRNLTITNTSNTANSAAIWLSSLGVNAGATNNRIINCNIQGSSTSIVNVFGIISTGNTIGNTTSGEDNDSLFVENNNFTQLGVGIYASGTSNNTHKGIVISKNTIGNSITANTVNSLGIYILRANGVTINANNIKNINGNNTGSPITSDGPVGILIEAGVVNAVISKNTIDSVIYAGTGGYGGKGIDLNTDISNSNIEVSNNMVSNILGDGWSSLSTDAVVGLRVISNTGNVRFYHNTVNLNGSVDRTSATVSAAIYAGANVTNLIVRNNIFMNGLVNNASISKAYAAATDITNPSNITINYNNYLGYGSQGVLGFLGADITTLAAWRTAIGQDANSISNLTQFVSSNNLHLTGSSIGNFNMKAAPIVGLNTDIDNDIRSASFYYMGADEVTSSPLPVKLLQFTGVSLNDDAKLNWATANETNNKGFFVERSLDGKLFETVKFVDGAGNSNRLINYQMIDKNAFAPANVNVLYYRLKQLDFDGKFNYSSIVKIVKTESKISDNVKMYPNPFTNEINVSFVSASNQTATIEILDIQGKLIQTNSVNVFAGFNNLAINNLNVLNNGFYFVRLTVNGEKQTFKLVKN